MTGAGQLRFAISARHSKSPGFGLRLLRGTLRAVARVLRPIFIAIWAITFKWWLPPLYDWKVRRNLSAEIRDTMSFLFVERHGQFIRVPRRVGAHRIFAEVTVSAEGLVFCFHPRANRDESGITVSVAPARAPRDSFDLSVALRAGNPALPSNDVWWWRLANLSDPLRAEFDWLKSAFAETQFEMTKREMRNVAIYGRAKRT
jgi:hypothetical protein